jgi:hypothetical protein
MASHEPFGHVQHKLWQKEGPLVDMDIVGYYYFTLRPFFSVNNPSNTEMVFCENMKLNC